MPQLFCLLLSVAIAWLKWSRYRERTGCPPTQRLAIAQDVPRFTLVTMHGPCASLATHGRGPAPDRFPDNAHPSTLVRTALCRRLHSQFWRPGV